MNTTKCLITSSGIHPLGRSLRTIYSENDNVEIIEYDEALGHDLSDPAQFENLISDLADCALFFNIGYPEHQEELLRRAFELQNELMIINLNVEPSTALIDNNANPKLTEYLKNKQSLDQQIRALQKLQQDNQTGQLCWIINLRMDASSAIAWEFGHQIIDAYDVAVYIYQTLGFWPKVAVQDLLIKPTFFNHEQNVKDGILSPSP